MQDPIERDIQERAWRLLGPLMLICTLSILACVGIGAGIKQTYEIVIRDIYDLHPNDLYAISQPQDACRAGENRGWFFGAASATNWSGEYAWCHKPETHELIKMSQAPHQYKPDIEIIKDFYAGYELVNIYEYEKWCPNGRVIGWQIAGQGWEGRVRAATPSEISNTSQSGVALFINDPVFVTGGTSWCLQKSGLLILGTSNSTNARASSQYLVTTRIENFQFVDDLH